MNGDCGDVEWFERTGHCGRCGQPGDFCLCTAREACGCKELHQVGAGRAPDAIDAFVEASHDQGGLF